MNIIKKFFLKKKLSLIKLIVLDVDGVLTDGNLYIDSNGNEIKKFNVKDGLGIKLLQEANIIIALISGGKPDSTIHRLEKLKIKHYFFEVKNKLKILIDLKKELNLHDSEVLYVGDDLNDLTVKNNVSLLVGTRDANIQFKKKCDLILNNEGGGNAVREIAERLLKDKFSYKFLLAKGFTETN